MNVLIEYQEIFLKLFFSIISVVVFITAQKIIEKLLAKRYLHHPQILTLKTILRNLLWLVCIIIVLMIWLGIKSNFTVAMGILGAGIAFASQETIGSFAGFINIITSNMFQVGDRIQIGEVIGDVLDISLMRTTLMEIGEWVKADQYSGRIVSVTNRSVFSDPVFNYTKSWPYLWDEFTVPITYQSDWRKAQEIILSEGKLIAEEYRLDAHERLHVLKNKYPIQDLDVDPFLFMTITDNWIEITLRYVTRVADRRNRKAILQDKILSKIEVENNITIASATFEIVGIPDINGNISLKKNS